MTKAKISEYDATAANNTDVNGVNIAEGCPPSGMNNMGREIMAALKRFQTGADGDSVTVGGSLVVSGSVTAANTATLGNVDINGGTIDGATIGGASAAAGTFTTATATTGNITTVNATTVDTTNLEVTNIKAKDGTASATIADSTGVITVTEDAVVNGLTVGRGAGDVSTNTAVGASALAANEAGGTNNTAVGYQALDANTTGDQNTAVGDSALGANTTTSNNTAVGNQALLNNTANGNTALGNLAGKAVTTGSKNTIIGRYDGNQGGLDIRTSSNYIVLSDGDGNPRFYDTGTVLRSRSTNNDATCALGIKRTTSVSTSATAISPQGSDFGTLYIVTGVDAGGNIFTDLIFSATSAGPTVLSAKSISGSPAGRTYSLSGSSLALAMASGTYDIRCAGFYGLG